MSGSVQAAVLLLAPGVPLILAFLAMLGPTRQWAMVSAPFAAAPALALVSLGTLQPPVELTWLMLGGLLGIDRVGRAFLLLTALIWLVGGMYARASQGRDQGAARFFVFFLLAMAGNLGLLVAQDMVLFYGCFALMSFATYGLVVHDASSRARRAGLVYLVFVVIGEMALFSALLIGRQAAGSLEFAQVRAALPGHPLADLYVGMILIGFGIKSGVLGLHLWMPLAYRAAPTPAAAVLSGAMFSVGLLGWLRFLPVAAAPAPQWGGLMLVAGLLATFFGVIVGLTQRHPKTLLAYSSMSQMGLMTAALGAALAAPRAWPLMLVALVVFAFHHALAKAALFLGIGVARAADRRQAWLVGAGLLLPALALAGLPASSGALAKLLLKHASLESGALGAWLYAALPWSSLATTLLLGRFLWLAWPRARAEHPGAPPSTWLPWLLLLLAVAGAVWWIPWVEVEGLWARHTLLNSLWPVAVGALVVTLAAWLSRRGWLRLPFTVPPGDLLVPVAFLVDRLLRAGDRWCSEWLSGWRRRLVLRLDEGFSKWGDSLAPERIELIITRWGVGIGFYLLLAIALATLMISLG